MKLSAGLVWVWVRAIGMRANRANKILNLKQVKWKLYTGISIQIKRTNTFKLVMRMELELKVSWVRGIELLMSRVSTRKAWMKSLVHPSKTPPRKQ